jgi:non-heme chloroperoxidase
MNVAHCPPLVAPLVAALIAPLSSQGPAGWRDPSPHRVQFVDVATNVRLEVLDWGGSGRPIVLLAGGGNTAHVFDDFAPKLTASGHVYGITRRGFGASGFAATENATERLRDDIVAVLETLKLSRPVLVGHSIAGVELSAVAASHPGRIASLVYLEAGYPYAFESGSGPTMKQFQQISGPPPPSPGGSDLASFSSLRDWDVRVFGFRTPEAEFRQTWDATVDGRPRKARDFPGMQTVMAALMTPRTHRQVPVPALVLFASPHLPEPWMRRSTDPSVRDQARVYFGALNELTAAQAKALESGTPNARVVRLPGAAHYIFLSHERAVLREMRAFLRTLGP